MSKLSDQPIKDLQNIMNGHVKDNGHVKRTQLGNGSDYTEKSDPNTHINILHLDDLYDEALDDYENGDRSQQKINEIRGYINELNRIGKIDQREYVYVMNNYLVNGYTTRTGWQRGGGAEDKGKRPKKPNRNNHEL